MAFSCAKTREGFEREGHCNAEICAPVTTIPGPESERCRPTAQIAKDCVILFLECPVPRFKMIGNSRRPVLVQPVINTAGDEIVSHAVCLRIVDEISMAKCQAPNVIGVDQGVMIRHAKAIIGEIIADLRSEIKPGARLKVHI